MKAQIKTVGIDRASLYVPFIKEWVEIVGCCLENGEFKLTWKSESGKLGTMSVGLCEELASRYVASF